MTGTTLPHAYKTTSLAIALLSGIASSAIGTSSANALTLMDMLRGKRESVQEQVEGARGVEPPISQRAIDMSDPEPLPKVSAPKYYTYKVDPLRAIKTQGFAADSATDFTRFIAEAEVSATADVTSAVEAYYAKNAQPLWVENEDVNERARAVLALLAKAEEFGLNPADYKIDVPALVTSSVTETPANGTATATATPASAAPASTSAPVTGEAETANSSPASDAAPVANPTDVTVSANADAPLNNNAPVNADAPAASAQAEVTPVSAEVAAPATQTAPAAETAPAQMASAGEVDRHQKALMKFELALSAKVVMFAQDLVRGRIDPDRISGYHDLERRKMDLATVLPQLQTAPDAVAYINSLEPTGPEYRALKAELARVRAESATDQTPQLPEKLLLKPGESSDELSKVIAAIQHRASDALKTQNSAILASYQSTPEYAPELVDLVKGFQKEAGLKPDGVIGPATLRAMTGHSAQDKIEKLEVAMEQTKWLPNDLGSRYVFINQPAFRVYYHDHGQEQFSMRVVVGSPSHQTFFFRDEIQTVELNPYWGVPQSIIVNEMLPKLRRDPSYLDRMGYQVEVAGRAVPSSSVNWYGSTQSISVRQPPSSDNALGELKILFPNAHAIYMHDTPQKSFFQRDMRALSHGCVRLAEPRKMAAAVLGISEQELGSKIAQGTNQAIQVPQKFPVYVAYFTAWPNKDGKVEYFDDVYDRDAAVEKAFEATSSARGA